MNDPYTTLQVHPKASPAVIEAAFQALQRSGKSKKLTDAYALLIDPVQRAAYDSNRTNLKGKVIGDYRIESEIAEGGFGTTYKGSHVLTGMPVCIKHCSRVSPDDTMILIEEAQAMWDLRHFGIPAVRSVMKLEDDSMALVMSFISGQTLEQVIAKKARLGKKIDPEDVAWILERALGVLYYLHRQGIVHGDVKPQNIMVQETHTIVLIDFGLSAIKPHAKTETKGYTELFAPPEQIAKKPLIPQIDLYSLAMTMLYALNMGDAKKTERQEFPATVPIAMQQFLLKFLSKDPLKRPDWSTENIMDTCQRMRQLSFGRAMSGMKPLF